MRFGTFGGGGLSPADALTPVATALPVISGALTVGSVMSATTGTWTNSPTSFAYQYNRNGAPISGATASNYTTVSADNGTILTVTITAKKTGHPSSWASSAGLAITASGVTNGVLDFSQPSSSSNSSLIAALAA